MNDTLTIYDDVREMIESVTDAIGFDAWSERVEEIESVARDGFIPFTNGGWNGTVTFGLHGEEAWSVDQIRPIVEADYKEMLATFLTEHDIADYASDDLTVPPELQQEWEDYTTEWEQGDDCAWFVYVRAIFYEQGNSRNQSGEDEFLFCLAINDDLNYGRDSISWLKGVGSHWIWERNIPVSELTPDLLVLIEAEYLQAWRNA